MWVPSARALRFIAQFARPDRAVLEREVLIEAGADGSRPATLYLPDAHESSGGAWVMLHGITVPGRHHAGVKRMARAFAAAGDVVIVPEVARWTSLEVTSRAAAPAVHAAAGWLAHLGPRVSARRVGLIGFSVSATWALEVAAGEERGRIAGCAGMGGYFDLGRMMRAMVVGEHEWEGKPYHYDPDPYGRWIMGGTLLPMLDDRWGGTREEREAAAAALRQLARTAGRHGAYSWMPVYDWLIAELRDSLPQAELPLWDILAPVTGQPRPDPDAGRELAGAMAAAALEVEPELDPRSCLDALTVPVMLLHGAADRLVPYTETLRLARAIPAASLRRVTITKLLGHTKRSEAGRVWNPLALGREGWEFARFIDEMLAMVEPV
jgi:pimeloyl-ACP methyl ester carboxylesterase